MNGKTLGLLFTIIQIGIFFTQFKAFETEFTTKTSLRTFLTIYMALSHRIMQIGKYPYLLELSKLYQIGAHAESSPGRVTLLLAPSRTDGPISRNPREKTHLLSLKHKICTYCILILHSAHFLLFLFEKTTIQHFVLLSH